MFPSNNYKTEKFTLWKFHDYFFLTSMEFYNDFQSLH